LKGQWVGKTTGTNTGTITADIDERSDCYEGFATFVSDAPGLPPGVCKIKTTDKSTSGTFTAAVARIDSLTLNELPQAELQSRYPGFVFPTNITVNYAATPDLLTLDWSTPVGTNGHAELPRSNADQPSDYTPLEMTWPEFKAHIEGLPYRRFIFRGQERPWRLRTAFHRSGDLT